MSLALSPKYFEVLTSSTSECDHVEVLTPQKLRMWKYLEIGMLQMQFVSMRSLEQIAYDMTGILIKGRRGTEEEKHREKKTHMMTEAKIRVLKLQVKNHGGGISIPRS